MERMSSGPSPQGQARGGTGTERADNRRGCSALDLMIAADAVDRALDALSDDDAREVGCIVMARRADREARREAAFAACESPIEKRMLEALLECGFGTSHGPAGSVAFHPAGVTLTAQRAVTAGGKSYRLDFAAEGATTNGGPVRIAIECDGHDFHERTKEQARHDRSRDRALTLAGWTVLRFTGSEIHADPIKCASDIIVAARCDTPKGAPMGPLKMSGPELAARTSAAVAAFAPKPRF